METRNAIFMSIDQRFLQCVRICLSSMEYFYKNHPEIIVYHTDLTDIQIAELSKITSNMSFIKNHCKRAGPVMDHLTGTVNPNVFYARFLLWKDPKFNEYDNILHLDADTIILGSLDPIFKKKTFFMVKEAYLGDDQLFYDFNDKELYKKISKDGINIENREGNAGVFLLPKNLRTHENYNEIIRILDDYGKRIKWADQSIINIWMYKHNFKLSSLYKYNYQHRLLVRKGGIGKTTKIIHFNGINSKIREDCMKKFFYIAKTKGDIKDYLSFYRKNINV